MFRLRSEAGSNLIEFALVLPLLLIVVFGIVDFSIGLYNKAVITNASREGARAGIVFDTTRPTLTDIQNVASNYCLTHLVTFGAGSTPRVDVTGAGGASGTTLTVNVEYDYSYSVISSFIPPLGGKGKNGSDLTLSATAVMRME